jgi:hypothetical protein
MIAARPSVINVCCSFFTLVAAPRQPQTRNGFPSGRIGNNSSCGAICRPRAVVLPCKSGIALPLPIICECTSSRDVHGPLSSTSARSLPTAFKRGFQPGGAHGRRGFSYPKLDRESHS